MMTVIDSKCTRCTHTSIAHSLSFQGCSQCSCTEFTTNPGEALVCNECGMRNIDYDSTQCRFCGAGTPDEHRRGWDDCLRAIKDNFGEDYTTSNPNTTWHLPYTKYPGVKALCHVCGTEIAVPSGLRDVGLWLHTVYKSTDWDHNATPIRPAPEPGSAWILHGRVWLYETDNLLWTFDPSKPPGSMWDMITWAKAIGARPVDLTS